MTRRIHRSSDFNVTLEIKSEDFLRPPRDSQRNWLLNRNMREFVDELTHLDRLASAFVAGSGKLAVQDRAVTNLTDEQIMEDWQIPVMKAMVDAVTVSLGDVLEIGFGRGVAASMIQMRGVRSHSICECNPSVIDRYRTWKRDYPNSEICLIEGMWQDRVEDMEMYDGVFFHTYPLSEEDFVQQVVQSVTFAEHFFPTASAHLKRGGIFTYLTNEIDSLSRPHQRLLFDHFRSFTLSKVEHLDVPPDTDDAMWSDSMVIVSAVK